MSFSSSEIAQLSKVIEENPRTWSPRRVLVTGGHGLVGSHLTRLLVKIGVEVNVLGRKHQMIDIGGNELLESRITYFNGPIWDKKLILKALEGCAVVFHAPYTDEECTNSVILKKELVLSTSLLIQACKETQVTRIVFVSSSKVVLDTSLTDGQFSFEALKYPKKFVSEASKALAEAERLVLNASLDYDMGILACSLRPHNIYDADSGFTKRTREGVNDFFSSFFLGKGSNLSDFTHASNVAIACVLAANKLSTFHANGRAYYISDQEIVPFWDFITLIREKYGWNYPYFGIMDTLSVWIGYISSWICFPRLVNYFSLEYSILATRSFYSQSTSAFEDFGYTPSIKTFKALSEINYSKSRHWNRSRGSIFEQTFFQVVFYFLLASAVTSFLTFSHYLGVDKAVTILSYVLISLVCGPLLTYISYIIFAFMEAPSDDSFENLDKRDLEMKVFFVTGGNRGIGFETAKILANLGGHVIIGCRDQKQGQMAIDRIKSESNCSGKVECIQLDLSSLVSVSNCVSAIQKRKILISHLINNAGNFTRLVFVLSIQC